MFEATGWTFASADGVVPIVVRSPTGGDYTILQRFDFDHARMTQSVVVRAPNSDQAVYVNGSFEKIGALCRPASLPADYVAIAQSHAMNGCYVLALASRSLGPAGAEVRAESERREVCAVMDVGHPRAHEHTHQTRSLQDALDAWKPLARDAMEADLTFSGLIIFRNELRPDSADTIAKLKVRRRGRMKRGE